MLLTVSKVLGEVFNAVSPLAGGFLSITASLGDCLVEMANAVNNSKTFKTTLMVFTGLSERCLKGCRPLQGY